MTTESEMDLGETSAKMHYVMDAAPLINNEIPSNGIYYTVPALVEQELRDKETRERVFSISSATRNMIQQTPSASSMDLVRSFAKQTGDLASLSAVDLQVIALTVDLAQQHDHWTMDPSLIDAVHVASEKEKAQSNQRANLPGWGSDDWITDHDITQDNDDDNRLADDLEKVDLAKESAITTTTAVAEESSSTTVACVSNDFAVQNVILRLKLSLVSSTGKRITQCKSWLLRCYACYWTTHQMERRFCDCCGNPTLTRTSYSVDGSTGKVTLYLKKNYTYNLRGSISAVGNPKGGRQDAPLLLREDQKEYQRAMKKHNRDQKKKAAKDVDPFANSDRWSSVFGVHGSSESFISTSSSSATSSSSHSLPAIGFGRRNPNIPRRRV